MPSSRTAIANRALTKLGSLRITDLSDNQPQARAVSSCYDMIRRAVLRSYRWNFAMTRASLPALASAPVWGFDNQFQLPVDFIRLDMVGESYSFPIIREYVSTNVQPWLVEGGKILTNLDAPLSIRYVADNENGDPAFEEAFASKLAVELCEPLTQGGAEKRKLLIIEFKDAISEARRCNAIENPPDALPDEGWLSGRLS